MPPNASSVPTAAAAAAAAAVASSSSTIPSQQETKHSMRNSHSTYLARNHDSKDVWENHATQPSATTNPAVLSGSLNDPDMTHQPQPQPQPQQYFIPTTTTATTSTPEMMSSSTSSGMYDSNPFNIINPMNNSSNNNNFYNPLLMNPTSTMYGGVNGGISSNYSNYGGFGNAMMPFLPANNQSTMMMPMMMSPPPPSTNMMMNGYGPFSTITNYLLGIQNVIMSIGQVVQIVSYNASSLQQLCAALLSMMDHVVQSYREQIQQQQSMMICGENNKNNHDHHSIDEEHNHRMQQQQQQRRIRVLRYTVTFAMSYLGYSLIRKLFFAKRRQFQQQQPFYLEQPRFRNYSTNSNDYHEHQQQYNVPTTTIPTNYDHQHQHLHNFYATGQPPPPPQPLQQTGISSYPYNNYYPDYANPNASVSSVPYYTTTVPSSSSPPPSYMYPS
jgi:hypothetical protein